MDDDNRVVIGMDPHKRLVTIEVMSSDEHVLGGGRSATDVDGFTSMLAYVAAWPDRVWASEGCEGIGRHVAQRLVAEGEPVLASANTYGSLSGGNNFWGALISRRPE